MNYSEHLCVIAMEECNEVAQRISKLSRFTTGEIQPGQDMTNGERVMQEAADLCEMIQMMEEAGLVPRIEFEQWHKWKAAKREKVKRFLEYSREMGTLTCPKS